MIKNHYQNKRVCEIHIIESDGDKWFEVFNYESPYLGFQSDSIYEVCDYIADLLVDEV